MSFQESNFRFRLQRSLSPAFEIENTAVDFLCNYFDSTTPLDCKTSNVLKMIYPDRCCNSANLDEAPIGKSQFKIQRH